MAKDEHAGFMMLMSPAKLMATENHYNDIIGNKPKFLKQAETIAVTMRNMNAASLGKLMDMSKALAEENWHRWQTWKPVSTPEMTVPAVCLYKGDAYRGLAADQFQITERSFAEDHLRILSGLYGILKPYDRIMPYRLMVGLSWSPNKASKNLYQYWRDLVSSELASSLRKGQWLVNLASDEYWKMIDDGQFRPRILHVGFREIKNGKPTQVSTFAKYARGMMARFVINNQITSIKDIRKFDLENYRFDEKLSSETEWIFSRKSK
jgi:cytoplasmic iron level regulating protein YaaA (DUF328/UPF0246 family)